MSWSVRLQSCRVCLRCWNVCLFRWTNEVVAWRRDARADPRCDRTRAGDPCPSRCRKPPSIDARNAPNRRLEMVVVGRFCYPIANGSETSAQCEWTGCWCVCTGRGESRNTAIRCGNSRSTARRPWSWVVGDGRRPGRILRRSAFVTVGLALFNISRRLRRCLEMRDQSILARTCSLRARSRVGRRQAIPARSVRVPRRRMR